MRRVIVLACLLTLASCGANPLSMLLGGGGIKTAANIQAGKTNTQTLGQTVAADQTIRNTTAQKIVQNGTAKSAVSADTVQHVTVNQTSPWTITPGGLLLSLFCWLALPSHASMVAGIQNALGGLFRRRKTA